MKLRILIAAALLFLPAVCNAASIVQVVAKDNDGSGSAFSIGSSDGLSPVTAGDTVVVIEQAVNAPVAPVDSASQTYSTPFTEGTDDGAYYKTNSAAITSLSWATPPAKCVFFVIELSGVSTFDVGARNAQTGTSLTSPSVTTTAANDLALGYAGYDNGSGHIWTPGSGWANITGTGVTNGYHYNSGNSELYVETKTLGSAGASAATMTVNGSATFLIGILAFKTSAPTVKPSQFFLGERRRALGGGNQGIATFAAPGRQIDHGARRLSLSGLRAEDMRFVQHHERRLP